ncbi:MAG: cation:proton antiporter, partial [Acidimicrobiia bacterium]
MPHEPYLNARIPAGALPLVATTNPEEIAAIVFIDIAVIMVVARLMGALFKRIRQPAVVGEILAGILLGPTLLGAFPGNLDGRLFPTEVRPYLKVVAQLGLIIFMFIVGLELDVKLIRGKERLAAVISGSSIALPFGLGFLLAAGLYGAHDIVAGEKVDFLPFALFIGASMSITAFPVLARILTERGMYRTETGAVTLACAAVDDILAWSLLAVVVAVKESTGIGDLPRILLLSVAFVAVMFTVVRRVLERVVDRYAAAGRLTPNVLAVILIGLLASSYATSKIGIHSIFGAFLFGAIFPREGTTKLFEEILERLENVSVLLLLPVFFIATGLDANVRGIGLGGLGELALILLVACAGKFIGATGAARAQGIPARKAAAIGVLMNTRGLTELVILNIGLEKGVLDRDLFTLLVVMAIFTTIITEPVLRLVYPDRILARDVADAEKAALGPGAFRVLVVVEDPAGAGGLVETGVDLVGGQQPAEVVITRFMPAAPRGELGSGLSSELADMATSMGALHELSARTEARSVRSVVLSQFSTDIPRDLVAQSSTVDADVVLVDAGRDASFGDGLMEQVLREAECDIAVLDARAERLAGPIVAMVGDGPHDGAAVELAARIARSRGAELRLVATARGRRPGRRLEALA